MEHLMSTLLASSLITTSPFNVHTEQSCWSPEVIINTKEISDIQLSPDNRSTLFVVSEPDMKDPAGISVTRIYKTNLFDESGAVPFSAPGISSMQPRWSPNGEWIAFLSDSEGVNNLYLIHSTGGEVVTLTKSKNTVQTFGWSPDGKTIALVMADETEKEKNREKTSLAYVYNEAKTINRLWLLDVFSSRPALNPMTSDDYCVRGYGDFGTINTEFDWSPDSKKITFAYSPAAGLDDFHLDSSLATLDVITGGVFPWAKNARFEAMPRYSPDGHWIAYTSSDSQRKYSLDRQVAVRSSNGQNPRLLSPTINEGAFLAGPNLLGWSHDGDHVLFFEPHGTQFHLVQLPMDGTPAKALETGEIFFRGPNLSQDRTMIGCVVQTSSTPPEAFVANLDNFKPVQVSEMNKSLASHPKIHTETISWTACDGLEIEGLLTYPVGYEQGKRYPLLLIIHGGPMGFFDETFVGIPNPYPIASFAEEGFLVFRPNPRGSTGYGKAFRCANYGDWAGSDFDDIMSGVDAVIESGKADADRLGVMGWSYGGYMTAWTVSQTQRFKAASIGAAPVNLVSMNGATDLYRLLGDYLGTIEENRELYDERSPLNYVNNVNTPCLIQHGSADERVRLSQAYELYHALDRLGKKTTLVIYPGMGHRLSDPKMQLDAMKQNLSWFKDHLLNR